ncbi:MAG: tetratricopeptide repeat protein [Archangiaceae bacterium]|nr:tetratricopeptide repeat protein [Archangiaceae bacterium]
MFSEALLAAVLCAAPLHEADALLNEAPNTVENLEAALRAYESATGLAPVEQARAHCGRSLALLRLGELSADPARKVAFFERGARAADEAVAADPTLARAHFYRGANLGKASQLRGAFSALGSAAELRKSFERARALDPGDVDAEYALGKLADALPALFGGSAREAKRHYERALAADPHHTRGKLELARFLLHHGDEARAVRLAEQVRDEPAPTRPFDWLKFDRPAAERLLAELAAAGRR